MVKRYEIIPAILDEPDGEWVKHSDYATLEQRAEAAEHNFGVEHDEVERLRRGLEKIADDPFLSPDANAGYARDVLCRTGGE